VLATCITGDDDRDQTKDQVTAELQALRAEVAALRERYALLHAVVEFITDAVYVKDAQGRYVMMNTAGARMIGKSVEEVIGRDDTNLFAPDFVRQIIEADREIIAGGASRTNEQFAASAGTTRSYLTTKGPYLDEQGHVLGLIGISHDITTRKRAEEALDESRRRLQALFDNALDAILLMDDERRFVDVNPAACALLGYSREEFLQLTAGDITTSQDRERIPELSSQFLATGTMFGEYVLLTRDGVTRDVEFRATAHILPHLHLAIIRDITERKQVEKGLRQIEEQFRVVGDSIPHMVWAARADGYSDYHSSRFLDYLGVTQEQLQGDGWAETLHPDDRQRARDAWELAWRHGGEFRIEYRIRNGSTGEYRWFVGHAVPHLDAAGRVVRWFGMCADIDERKRAEEAQRDLLGQVQLLLDSTAEAIYGMDLDGHCTFCNPACLRLLGYTDTRELLGKQMHGLVHHTRADKTTYPATECPIFQAIRQGDDTHSEYEVLWRADGTSFPAECWSYPVRRGGCVVGAVVTFVDISERRRVEEELLALNAALENAVEGIARVDAQGHFLAVNRAYAGMLRYEPEELVGMDCQATVHPEDREIVSEARRRMRAEGRAEAEVRGLRKDGTVYWKHIVIIKAQNQREKSTAHYCFMKDITERTQAESALRDLAKRLQVLSRRVVEVQEQERRHLARELHDEIGQIFCAIGVNLHALKGVCDPAGWPRIEESLHIVDRATQQVRNLSLDLRPSILDDLGLVATLRWYADRQAQRAGFALQLVVESSGTRLPTELETACFRVAQEALTNVVKHSGARQVGVAFRQDDDGVHLVIRDDGVGFDPETARRRVAWGEGLGLLGIKERVELLGGRADIQSQPGQGTTIRIWFPIASEPSGPDSAHGGNP